MSKKFQTLNIGAATVELAEYEAGAKGALTLVNYGTAALAAPVDAENAETVLSPALGEIVRARGMRPGKVALAVSGQMAFQRFAAIPAAGGDERFDKGIKMNSIGFFGLHIMSAGTYTEPVLEEVTDRTSKKLYAAGGVLTGFILVGDVRRAGIYTSLIRERTPLSQIDFEAVKREPSLLPFGREIRKKKLGGVV